MITSKALLSFLFVASLWEKSISWCPNTRLLRQLPQVAARQKLHTERNMMLVSEAFEGPLEASPFVIAGVALLLGGAAQSFINQMLQGDQGLGAFLKDGSGYSKSGFRQVRQADEETQNDPLPWLKLPQLDFVEVAGQTIKQEDLVYQKMEEMRLQMNQKLQDGKVEEASAMKEELERIMNEAGIEYRIDI